MIAGSGVLVDVPLTLGVEVELGEVSREPRVGHPQNST